MTDDQERAIVRIRELAAEGREQVRVLEELRRNRGWLIEEEWVLLLRAQAAIAAYEASADIVAGVAV